MTNGSFDQQLALWLVLLVVFLVIEIATMGLTTIWFAAGAVVATLLALVHAPFWLQLIVFLLVSIVMLIFTRPVAVKYFNRDRVRTNVESMIGKEAIVVYEVDNLQGLGRVIVGGQEWSARSTQNDIKIPVGAVGIVKAIDGVKLIIEERKEGN